jgi:predicted SprT family Zn-dependent metalloprotease
VKLDDAASMARKLMREHGVGHLELAFTRRKRELGSCVFSENEEALKINLSAPWFKVLPEEHARDTILHEIAHALVGWNAQHGPDWQRMARLIGANPERRADGQTKTLQASLFKYHVVCPNTECKEDVLDYTDKPKKGGLVCASCRTPVEIRSNTSHPPIR